MGKQWCLSFASFFAFLMVMLGGLTIWIDPYFHYHKPLNGFAYKIYNERYQNDGIVKHFDYDALITGTSMVQNFKTSEMDKLFQVHTIKVPYSGAAYKEIRENLERAIQANPELKIVVWGLDYNRFYGDFNATRFDSYPTYLYDDCLWNDVQYFCNKSVLVNETCINVIAFTRKGGKTTTFDEYNNWNARHTFGKKGVLKDFKRPALVKDASIVKLNTQNMENNVLSLIKEHPEIDFYLFWTPYSIAWFDLVNRQGNLKNILAWEKEALIMMLPYKNVHLFSFFDEFGIITSLDNYKDMLHYHERINSYMLQCMATGKHQITMDNYEEYCKKEWDFYTNYDYDAIYK